EQPIWISNWQTDEHSPGAGTEEQNAESGQRWLCRLPLQTHQGCLGVLSVSIDQPDRSEEEMQLLSLAADQIALGLTNSLLRAELEKLKDGLDLDSVYVESEQRSGPSFDEIIGRSPALQRVLRQVEVVAPTDSGVLIQGETGTGKELIAQAIHNRS